MLTTLGRAQARWFAIPLFILGCRDVQSNRAVPSAQHWAEPMPIVSASAHPVAPAELEWFRRIFRLSEAGEPFISDNVVSNETSLLQPAAALEALRGGVYVGVGPEQNYTYIALSRPDYAILIDLRRDNALLHLLYKSLFERASSRFEFVCMLLGRPYQKELEPTADVSIDDLLAALVRVAPDAAWHERQYQLLAEGLQRYDLGLSSQDLGRIRHFYQLFFDRQLELRFELHQANSRNYPSLGQLLRLRSASGRGTFLGSNESFATVQRLHRQHRIVPVVGDVSARRPLTPIAEELRQRSLVLRTLYISNVEQYLIGQPSFQGWLDNLRQLPHDEHSVLLRCYLDQGRRHPRQRVGSRATTLAHGLQAFLERTSKRPYSSFYKLVTDESLDVGRFE